MARKQHRCRAEATALRLIGGFAFGGVGVGFCFAGGIEDHCWTLFGAEGWPCGEAGVVGIAGASEVDPRVAYLGGKVARFGAVAGHVLAALGVVEAEG